MSRDSRFLWLTRPNRVWLYAGIGVGFVLGLVITLARDVIVPEHFRLDSDRIQSIAQGLLDSSDDRTFEWVALIYRAFGLQDAPIIVAIGNFALTTSVILFAVWRSRRREAAPFQSLFIVITFVMSSVYLSDYSKDIFVLIPVMVLLLVPSRLWGDLVLVAVMLVYAATLRQYWAIVAAGYVAYRLITINRVDSRRLVAWGIAGLVVLGLVIFVLTNASPDVYRVDTNATRSVLANTQIDQYVHLPEPLGGLINLALAYFFLVVPLPLLITAGPQYLPVVALFAVIWVPLLWSLRGWAPSPRVRSVLFARTVSLAFAFLVTQALFEPDYGSALRHLTPLLPVLLVAYLVVMPRNPAERESGIAAPNVESGMLVIHWGQNGGGPRFATRMADELRTAWTGHVYTSFNRDAEIFADSALTNDFPVSTYRSKLGVLLGLPRLVVTSIRLTRFIRRNKITVVYSPMLSIWQSVFTFFFLPRDVFFAASIHDAVEHPGDANRVLRWCRRADCARADVVVAYSESAARELREQLVTRDVPVIVVPHGADAPTGTPRTSFVHPAGPRVLGFVGRIVEYKGLDLFVDVVEKLARESDVRGLVVGDGEVDSAVRGRGNDDVEWRVGWIPEPELPRVFDEIDVLVLPYREASQSGVMTLGLSAGVPIVATPVGGLREQLEVTGAGVVASDVSVSALVDAVKSVLEPATYQALSVGAIRAASESVSWERSAHVLVAELSRPREAISRLHAVYWDA